MKSFKIILALLFLSAATYGQEEPSKKMPPISMLPKKGEGVKQIYELPHPTEYKVFNQAGEMMAEGNGEFIDCTKYPTGTYFIRYDEKTVTFEHEQKKK